MYINILSLCKVLYIQTVVGLGISVFHQQQRYTKKLHPSNSTWPLQCLVLPAGSVALPGPRCPRHLRENKENVKKHEGFSGEWTKTHAVVENEVYTLGIGTETQDASDHQDYETFLSRAIPT